MLDIKGEFATHVSNTVASDIVKGSDALNPTMYILCEGGHYRHRPSTAAILLFARSPSSSRASPNFCWPDQEADPQPTPPTREIGKAGARRVARQP